MPIFHILFRKIGRSRRWRCSRCPGPRVVAWTTGKRSPPNPDLSQQERSKTPGGRTWRPGTATDGGYRRLNREEVMGIFVRGLAVIAALITLRSASSRGGRRLSIAPCHADRTVASGGSGRHTLPHIRSETDRQAWQEHRCREPAGRWISAWGRHGGARGAGRIHVSNGRQRVACDNGYDLQEAALRPDQGLCTAGAHRAHSIRIGGKSVPPGELGDGPDQAGQEGTGPTVLCFRRAWLATSSLHGVVQEYDRH